MSLFSERYLFVTEKIIIQGPQKMQLFCFANCIIGDRSPTNLAPTLMDMPTVVVSVVVAANNEELQLSQPG